MNAATRAVIERLIEASKVIDECYCEAGPYLNAPTRAKHRKALIEFRAAIAEARKLLEGDALAQPADEDAWLERAIEIAEEMGDRCFRNDTERQLRAHLRTRPQQAGFVSVPVKDYEGSVLARWRFLMAEMQKRFPHPAPFDSTKTPEQYLLEAVDAMIAAATKGDGK